MDSDQVILGLVWYVVFLLSTTGHEAAHALAAKLGGDETAARGGQVSLDPLPHIRREPFGMVLVPWLSYFSAGWMMGWASAPYDPHWAHTYPRRAAKMALAGPTANLALAAIAAVALRIGMALGVFQYPERLRFAALVDPVGTGVPEAAAALLSIMFSLNILLAAFNMLPLPPLDGWSAAGLLLPESGARKLVELTFRAGMFQIVGLLVAWKVFGYIFPVVLGLSLRVLFAGLG